MWYFIVLLGTLWCYMLNNCVWGYWVHLVVMGNMGYMVKQGIVGYYAGLCGTRLCYWVHHEVMGYKLCYVITGFTMGLSATAGCYKVYPPVKSYGFHLLILYKQCLLGTLRYEPHNTIRMLRMKLLFNIRITKLTRSAYFWYLIFYHVLSVVPNTKPLHTTRNII